MNKVKISIIFLVLAYLVIGTFYHARVNYCEEQSLLNNPELMSEGAENTGSNLIGRTITTIFWPLFLIGDGINHVGIFDCKS